jgi:2-polyprenyl-3-methyl-5-hydroxy-6-metoxy-1,4-benzoquinol methylase
MRVAIFLMGNADSSDMARPLVHALARAGAEITLVHYSSEEVVPVDDLIATGARYLPLSDGGFGTIPRLSARQYLALCGDDVDFLGCQYHNLARLGFPPTREYLFQDSMFHQWFRGFAYRAQVILRESRPDYVVVNHGSEPLSKILYAKSRALGLPTLLMESSFLPGRLLLDPVGMHFFPGQNRIERDWPRVRETPLTEAERLRLGEFLEAWKSRGVSKYAQSESPAEVRSLRSFLDAGRRTLFVVDQIPYDANIINGFRAFDAFGPMVAMARDELPEGWSAAYKLHPRNPEAERATLGASSGRFFTARDVSIHRLFEASDAVLTYSSNVGLEAVACGKPVIVAGLPHYGGRGLTLDLTSKGSFSELLEQSTSWRPDATLRDRLLNYVFFDYLIPEDDVDAILARLREAEGTASQPAPRCPLSAHYVERFAEFRDQADRYNQLSDQNLAHEEILARIGPAEPLAADSGPNWSRLDSGERQVAVDYSGIAENHLIRYRLARELVEPGMSVLDLSCGTGYGTFALAAGTGAHATGVDCSEDAIAFAREFWSDDRVEYVRASAGSFPFAESAYDLIVSFETVEHLANDRAFVDQLWRSLRPGGLLLLSAPNQVGYAMRGHEFHVQHYTGDSLLALLRDQPGMAEATVLGQVADTRIEGRAGGKHLIAVARKASPGADGRTLAERLAPLLPYTESGPPDVARSPIRILPHRFRIQAGELSEGVLRIGREAENLHAIHGPFIRCAEGDYAASFLLGIAGGVEGPSASCVVLDVATGEGRPLGRQVLRARHLEALDGRASRVVVPFRHRSGADILQFRIYVEGRPYLDRLEFHGLELRRFDMAIDEGPERESRAEERDPFRVLDLVAIEREETESVRRELDQIREEFARARSAYEQADAYFRSSRADWEDRFRAYERRLMDAEQRRSEAECGRIWFSGQVQIQASERAKVEEERLRLSRENEELRAQREHLQGQLAESQTQLRPYRVIDRMGFVHKGWHLARSIKRKLVS